MNNYQQNNILGSSETSFSNQLFHITFINDDMQFFCSILFYVGTQCKVLMIVDILNSFKKNITNCLQISMVQTKNIPLFIHLKTKLGHGARIAAIVHNGSSTLQTKQ